MEVTMNDTEQRDDESDEQYTERRSDELAQQFRQTMVALADRFWQETRARLEPANITENRAKANLVLTAGEMHLRESHAHCDELREVLEETALALRIAELAHNKAVTAGIALMAELANADGVEFPEVEEVVHGS
jgi:hypothetical protein